MSDQPELLETIKSWITLDNKIRAYDSTNGDELWSFKLPYSGSWIWITFFL